MEKEINEDPDRLIIIEGVDNTGKTTLGLFLAKYLHRDFVKPAPCMELKEVVDASDRWQGPLVVDRYNFISEWVYGEVIRNNTMHPAIYYEGMQRLNRKRPIIIICQADPLRDMEKREQMKGVKENIRRLMARYSLMADNIMIHCPRATLFFYNWREQTPKSILKKVQRSL